MASLALRVCCLGAGVIDRLRVGFMVGSVGFAQGGFSVMFVQVIILIGNKADLEAQRDVTYEEAKQFAEENGE